MKLYNQAQMTFDLDKTKVIKGGSYRPHDAERRYLHIKPKDKFEVTEEYGKKLMGMYPNVFMQLDEAGAVIKPAKKAKKKVAKKKIAPVVKKTVKKTKKR